jgi:anti-anti-sigma factor
MRQQNHTVLENTVLVDSGASVVQLPGSEYASIHGARLRSLRRLLLRLANEPGPEPLVLDLSSVHFFGAGFIGVLVDTWAQLKAQDRQLVLRDLTPFCGRLIRALHLHKLFAVASTPRGALDNHIPTAVGETVSAVVRIRKSDVAWDADMVRLEYVGDDGTPIRCVIVPRTADQDR